MEEKKKRWRPSVTAYRELEKELTSAYFSLAEEKESYKKLVEDYNDICAKNNTLERSNKYVEDRIIEMRKEHDKLESENLDLRERIAYLEKRGFWTRLFNK